MEVITARPQLCCVTNTVQEIFDALDVASTVQTLGVIAGIPGTGKTTAIEEYERQEQRAHVIRVTESKSSRAALLRAMFQKIGLPEHRYQHGGASAHWDNIESLINSLGTVDLPLFIIDEAQKLQRESVEMLREIYDEAYVSFVLVTNPESAHRIANVRIDQQEKAARARMAFPQLAARVSLTRVIDPPSRRDVNALCDYFEIQGDDARLIFSDVVARHGHLHQVRALVSRARQVAGSEQALNEEHLKAAVHSGRNR